MFRFDRSASAVLRRFFSWTPHIAAVVIAATASAGTVFYDFHGSGGATVVDAAAPYNVIQFDTGLGTMNFTGLTDDTGAGGYSLAFTREGTVISTDSGGPDDGTFVAEAYGDGFYMKEPDGGIEIVFGGLDDSRLYELSVFADSGLFLTTDVDFSVGGQSNTGVNTTEAVSFTLAGLQPSGGELLLTIQANGSGKELERGPALNAALLMETGPADPDAPTDLTAAALNQNEIELSWTDNSTVETGFEIQRSSGGGAFAVVDTVATDVTSYVDGGLTPSTAYTYRVRANTGSGPSDDSNEATATTDDLPPAPPDAAPSGLAVEVLAANVLELAWTDASSNETGFSIERDGGAGFTEIATVGEGVTLFRDIGLSPSSTYVYRVVAFNDLGASAPSNTDSATTPALGEGPLNVLMIVLDDMAASAVGHPAYGETHPSIQTPALDRLCDEGLAFTQAYSNWAACMPARQMFMSGKNVEASDWRNNSDIRNQDGMNRSAVYVHQHFQANGYSTVRLDKVFHIGQDVPNGWDITEEPFGPNRQNVVIQANELSTLGLDDNVRRQIHLTEGGGEDRTVYEMDATDESGQPIDADRLTDGITKTRALELLDDFASPGGTFDAFEKPFFMAVGLRRPHLPYVAPAEYYGRFNWGAGDDNVTDPSTAEIVLPPFNRPFTDEAGFRQSLEGYYACTAMSDDHIGDLLDKLDATGLAGNTLVVVFGDNGYGLGEHNNFFSKGTPDNVGFHVPLIFRVPGGARVDEVEEKAVTLMDIYPTLVELCGLPDPNTPLDGKSLAPLLEAHDPNWVEEAYGLIGGSRDASDPLGGLIWARGHKYYEGESGDPREFYAVAAGDRFEWNPLLGSPSLDALEADLDTRLASLRERSLASLPPALDQHAVSQVVAEGGDALFSVRDSGDEVLTVTWTKDGEVLAGETKASLLLEQLVPADAGVYQASVVDRDGRTLSYRAELRVIATPSTLFDWKIDEIEAPFILDGVNGGSFSEVGFVSDSFGPTTKTVFDTGTGGTAIVKPGLPGGDYRVSIWNPTWGNAASDVDVTLHARGGDTTVAVDQAGNPAQWFDLGTYAMGPGSYVTISTDSATGRVAVDGLRFERLSQAPNQAPVAADDGTHATVPDAPVTVDLLANDSDADAGDTLSILQCSGGRFGAVSLAAGVLTYTPRPGVLEATDTIYYQVTDGKDRSNIASVAFTVSQSAGTSAVSVSTNGDGSVDVAPSATTVADGSAVTLTAEPHPGYQFYYWSGPQDALENPLSLTAGGNDEYTAIFRPIPQLTSYAAWAAEQDWLDPGSTGPEENSDADAYVNLVEYGLDLGVRQRDADVFEVEVDPASGEKLFRYRRSLNAPEADVTVLVSSDLAPGSWSPYGGTEWIIDFDPDGDFTAQKREIRFPASSSRQFVRIEVAP